ncbi:hypothetical protein OROGR_007160 [Orobanche gracilis]
MEIDEYVYRAFCILFDAKNGTAELPSTFVEGFGNRLSNTCSFIDTSKDTFNALAVTFVREEIFPAKPAFCVIRDQLGRRFFCEYQYGTKKDDACTITVGWLNFVKSNNLREGSDVKLGIQKGDPSVIHAKVIYPPVAQENQTNEGYGEVKQEEE